MKAQSRISPWLASLRFGFESGFLFQILSPHLALFASSGLLGRTLLIPLIEFVLILFMFRRRAWAALGYSAIQLYELYGLIKVSLFDFHLTLPMHTKLMVLSGVAIATLALIETASRRNATYHRSLSTNG